MSRAPTRAMVTLAEEIHHLERSLRALEEALAEAKRSETRTADGLEAVRKRIVAKTEQAIPAPDDAPLRRRIVAAIESACGTAARALAARWGEIRATIMKALSRVQQQLDEKRRSLRRLESERLQQADPGGSDARAGAPGSPGGASPPSGGSSGGGSSGG